MATEKREIAAARDWELAKILQEGEPLELGQYVLTYDYAMNRHDALALVAALYKELQQAQSHVQSKHNAMRMVIKAR